MTKSTDTTGRKGEDLAVAHLRGLGYNLLDRNYRCGFGEIDIIARDEEFLVFVEVKTRRSAAYGTPFEAVDLRKQRRICRVALDYINKHRLHDQPVRFDVAAVFMSGKGAPRVEILQNCFEFYE